VPTTPAPRQPRVVVAPDDLVQLIGEQRLRQLHAAMAAELRSLTRGGTVTVEIQASAGGVVVDVELERRRRLQ
jgi:hypothetical protein